MESSAAAAGLRLFGSIIGVQERAQRLESGNRGSINTEIIERAGGLNVVDANLVEVTKGQTTSHVRIDIGGE